MDVSIGSVVIHSTDPKALRDWYANAFGAGPDDRSDIGDTGHGMRLGEQYLVFFTHEEITGPSAEPSRIIVNFTVDDAQGLAAKLASARWVRPLEQGGPGWIGTVTDPDGNLVQIIQLVEGADAPA